MTDYGRIFGEPVASGLGLGRSAPIARATVAEYAADPAEAFSRMAECLQAPGGGVPLPFATQIAIVPPDPRRPLNHSKE